MSRNNQINSRSWTTSEITEDTVSDIWDFFEEAFEGLDEITFNRDNANHVMYIYLDENKKVYITVKVSDLGTGVLIEFWLNGEKCSYKDTTQQTTTMLTYFRTKYGIAWGLTSSIAASYSDLGNVYVQKSTPTLVVGVKNSATSTYYILSPLHDKIEAISEQTIYLSNNLGDQKLAITNAYSCLENLKIRHLFRVLGIPNSTYPQGRIEVGGKKLFWFGRFALEYEEEE